MFGNLPPVIKNLLIINILVFMADQLASMKFGINLGNWLALHNFQSEHFSPIQLVTYMFMHGNVSHIFFNMLALVMFGRVLEQVWGGKRFYVYYFVTGIGAALCQMCVLTLQTDLDWRRPFADGGSGIYRSRLVHPRYVEAAYVVAQKGLPDGRPEPW